MPGRRNGAKGDIGICEHPDINFRRAVRLETHGAEMAVINKAAMIIHRGQQTAEIQHTGRRALGKQTIDIGH